MGYTEVKRLDQPVAIDIAFTGKGRARTEGNEQRWEVPIQPTSSSITMVKDRKYPFLQGKPRETNWSLTMSLPENATVSFLPKPARLNHPCLDYSRVVTKEGRQIQVEQQIKIKCERVPLAQVPAVQELFTQISRSERSEIVLKYN